TPPKKSKKPLFVGLFVALAVVLGSAGYVFGYYIPNKPENVWKTGLNRSGDTLAKLVAESTTEQKIEKLKSSKSTITTKVRSEFVDVDGQLVTRFDSRKSDSTLELDLKTEDYQLSSAKNDFNLRTALK